MTGVDVVGAHRKKLGIRRVVTFMVCTEVFSRLRDLTGSCIILLQHEIRGTEWPKSGRSMVCSPDSSVSSTFSRHQAFQVDHFAALRVCTNEIKIRAERRVFERSKLRLRLSGSPHAFLVCHGS